MSRILKKLPSLSNVQAGSTATLECPLGRTYDRITLEYAGVTPAQIKSIRLKIDGKDVWRFKDAVRLNLINTYYARGVDAGYLDFHFVRPEMTNLESRRMFALGTADVRTMSIEFDIDSAATNPEVTAYAIQSPQTQLGLITKFKEFAVSTATAGEKEIDNIPRRARVGALHLVGKDDIASVIVEVDGFEQYNAPKTLSEKIQTDVGRTPLGANGHSIDFIREGNPMNALALQVGERSVQDFRVKPSVDTAGAFDVVVEYYDQWAGI